MTAATPTTATSELRARNASQMPEAIEDLRKLVSRASVSFAGFPAEPVHAMSKEVLDLFTRAGVPGVRLLDLGEGYPAIYADVPGPEGAPTVLLYGHYDVQPAPMEQGWTSDPFTMGEENGRFTGRGSADDKSGIIIHANALRLFEGRPPVSYKLLIEGEEEASVTHLAPFVAANPELFKADVMVIADMGNMIAGEPVLTTTLRGHVQCIVETKTVDRPLHSGVFGGVAPDALVALIRVLNGLWDESGKIAVPGLHAFEWIGAEYPEETYRRLSGLLPGVQAIGSGSVASRLWSQPNVTVIGLDAPKVAEAGNVLLQSARAKVAMRIAPGADADRELAILMDFLRDRAPWGVQVEVTRVKASRPFIVKPGTPAVEAARGALAEAYGEEVSEIGSGGSIPLLDSLAEAWPEAEFILWGAEDAIANIHGANESVDPAEIEKMALAEALLLRQLGESAGQPRPSG
jgi:cysteinylglycine-S-conjugate dipeptidase